MIVATVFTATTGKILRSMVLKDAEEVAANCVEGEAWIEGKGDPKTQRVVGGLFVPRDPAEIEAEDIAAAWVKLRSDRTVLLYACDWTQAPDAPVDQSAWAVYRQALRDLPDNTTDPRNPPWPTPPA